MLHDPPRSVLISAFLYDGYITGDKDEAFQLYNFGPDAIDLEGWRLTNGSRSVTFPPGIRLQAHATLWCGWSAAAFTRSFGEAPGCEYGEDSAPAIPNLLGSAPQFGNSGGRIVLSDPRGRLVDALPYKNGDTSAPGWHGSAVAPYRPSNSFAESGQVLYRKLDALTGLPAGDSDSREDWAQEPEDVWGGRKVRYPGWVLDRFAFPLVSEERARLQVIVAPDHSYAAFAALLSSATTSIRFEGYTFESAEMAELLANRARDGITVTLLLEGSPAGGVTDQQRWCMEQIETGGGRVYALRAEESGIRERYLYQHAKFWLLDERTVLVGSENPSPEAFPADDKADGTLGRRGVYLLTDARAVVDRLTEIMNDDLDLAHADIWRWDAGDTRMGRPPDGYEPVRTGGGTRHAVGFPAPLDTDDTKRFEVVQAPEGALYEDYGLIRLLREAGAGATVLVEQLYEHTFWGAGDSNVVADPNPRLEEYLAAARRGAKVRILLDSLFDAQDLDDPRSNLRTVEYLESVARREGLDLQARRGNPTGLGLHNKMVLVQINGQGWVMAGSLNGGEVSAKLNREVALLAASSEAYAYLSELFWSDWGQR
jgi:cardiolipin synthase A/B